MRCQCCGGDGSTYPITVVHSSSDPVVATCSLCHSLICAGLLRRELHDGEIRYRKWHMQWIADDLLPRVVELDDSDGIVRKGAV